MISQVQENAFAAHACMKNAWGSDCKTQLDPDMPTMHINDATVEVMNSAKLWEYYEDNFDQTSFVTGCNIFTNFLISILVNFKTSTWKEYMLG